MILSYLKWGAILGLAAALFGLGYRFGGSSARTALARFQAAQAMNTAKAVLAERAADTAETARVNAILKGYEDAPIDPVALTLGNRVLEYARVADCPVPKAGGNTGGTPSPSPVAVGPSAVGRALDALTEACAEDAAELTALQAAWPR